MPIEVTGSRLNDSESEEEARPAKKKKSGGARAGAAAATTAAGGRRATPAPVTIRSTGVTTAPGGSVKDAGGGGDSLSVLAVDDVKDLEFDEGFDPMKILHGEMMGRELRPVRSLCHVEVMI